MSTLLPSLIFLSRHVLMDGTRRNEGGSHLWAVLTVALSGMSLYNLVYLIMAIVGFWHPLACQCSLNA